MWRAQGPRNCELALFSTFLSLYNTELRVSHWDCKRRASAFGFSSSLCSIPIFKLQFIVVFCIFCYLIICSRYCSNLPLWVNCLPLYWSLLPFNPWSAWKAGRQWHTRNVHLWSSWEPRFSLKYFKYNPYYTLLSGCFYGIIRTLVLQLGAASNKKRLRLCTASSAMCCYLSVACWNIACHWLGVHLSVRQLLHMCTS
jgi:hypothetical protein